MKKSKKNTVKTGNKTLVTPSQFSKLLGISRQAVHKLIERGDIPLFDGLIEPVLSSEIVASGRLLNRNGNGNSDETLADARRRLICAKANIAELEFSLKKGDVLEKTSILEANQRIIKNAQIVLRGIPVKIAPLLISLTTEVEIQELLLLEIDRALQELANLGTGNDNRRL